MRLNGFDREMLNQLGNSLNALKGPRDFIYFISVAISLMGDMGISLSLVYFQLTKECVGSLVLKSAKCTRSNR